MKFKVIILDFDGTIVESVGIKDEAFKTLFEEYPDHLEEITNYHLSHNATVRFEKFRHITENILRQKYTEEIERTLSKRFSELVFQKIVECPYVRGAEDFLNFFMGRVPLYLASASPADELSKILSLRNMTEYFKKIYAVPWKKTDVIADILRRENVAPKEAVAIGDSLEDYRAALSMKIFFVGRQSGKFSGIMNIPILNDLIEIRNFLCNMTPIRS